MDRNQFANLKSMLRSDPLRDPYFVIRRESTASISLGMAECADIIINNIGDGVGITRTNISKYYLGVPGFDLFCLEGKNSEVVIMRKEGKLTCKEGSEIGEELLRFKIDGNELEIVKRCLNEALHRCRKVNLVELEPDILLASVRLEWVRRKLGKWESLKEMLKKAREIAERAGYRLKLTDIHLSCGEVLLEMPREKLLKLTVREHLQLVKEYAKEVSILIPKWS